MDQLSAATILFILTFVSATGSDSHGHRSERALIFPRANPARHQLVAGFGIPVDVVLESITVGYVFKAVYFLPWNSSHWVPQFLRRDEDTLFEPVDPVVPAQRRNFVELDPQEEEMIEDDGKDDSDWADRSRWEVYRALEAMADQRGHNGRSCLLRTICEAAEARFTHSSGIIGELLHILFTPSSSVDRRPADNGGAENHLYRRYQWAETLATTQSSSRSPGGSICADMFTECPFSLMGLFTGIFE